MSKPWLPRWLATYDGGKAAQDAVAGIVVTILLVPQSLAYAMLAGLPPHVGMYASILPLVAYAVLGSSMTLSVGRSVGRAGGGGVAHDRFRSGGRT